MQKPSLARMVLVGVEPEENNGSDIAPATIVRVWNDTMVNLKVHLDGPGDKWKTSVKLCKTEEDGREHGILNACWWPPRV
jgi:hypothetical protein